MKLIEDLGMHFATDTSKIKVRFGLYECPNCLKPFKARTSNVKNGCTTKCLRCATNARALLRVQKASTTFTGKAIEVHGEYYDYSLVDYINSYTPIDILCPVHGIFSQMPNAHLKGQGCPKCSGFKDTTESFILKAKEVHNNAYDYSVVEYVSSKTCVDIICKTHGLFPQTPNSHLSGYGCPICAKTGFDKTKSAILYYLKVTFGGAIAYKIGITNRTVQERFISGDLEKIQVLEVWKFSLGADAYSKEQKIIRIYKDFKYKGEPLLQNGNTELFTVDILGLDL